FKNPLNSPALRMTWRATQPSIQHCSSLEIPSPRTGSMPNPVAVCTTCGADAAPRPAHKAIINRCRRTILRRAITPATPPFQHMHDTGDDAAIIRPLDPAHIRRQVRFDPLPLLIAKPKQVPGHDPNPLPKTNQDRIVRAEKLMSSDPSRDICRPSGDCDRERAAVRRNPGQEPAAGGEVGPSGSLPSSVTFASIRIASSICTTFFGLARGRAGLTATCRKYLDYLEKLVREFLRAHKQGESPDG